jgi:CRISPR-associated protein (TIGR02584 family)
MKPTKPKSRRQPSPQSASQADSKSEIRTPKPEIILLAVTGMSPAVLTETVWALAHGTPAIIPSRIIAVTTSEGRRQIEQHLFQPLDRFGGQTPWDALRNQLASLQHKHHGRLRFGTTGDDVRVITALDGRTGRSIELTDLRQPPDNEAAADFLLEQVRAIVENPDTRLIASIAGGRKTMGALLYGAMSLLGRETDRLTHVLVSEPFETLREFYFPGQPGGGLPDRDGRVHDPGSARVELANVPFVPLRNRFQEIAGLPGSFRGLTARYSKQLRTDATRKVRIEICHAERAVVIDDLGVPMRPKAMVILHALLDLTEQGVALRGQLEAQDPINTWISKQQSLAWQGHVDGDGLKHELNHLRTVLKRRGAAWWPPVRSLQFPPFQLVPAARRR